MLPAALKSRSVARAAVLRGGQPAARGQAALGAQAQEAAKTAAGRGSFTPLLALPVAGKRKSPLSRPLTGRSSAATATAA